MLESIGAVWWPLIGVDVIDVTFTLSAKVLTLACWRLVAANKQARHLLAQLLHLALKFVDHTVLIFVHLLKLPVLLLSP